MEEAYRKRRKVYNEPGHAHHLTFSCVGRLPLLSSDLTRQWTTEAIDVARQRHEYDLYAYVIMPEHVHLLVRPRRVEYNLSAFLYGLKRPVSWKVKQQLTETGEADVLTKLMVNRGGSRVFRLWLAGGGFDRNIFQQRTLLEVIDYIHGNPVRRGLADCPTDWSWSSARFWAGMEGCPLTMDPLPL